MKNTIMALAAVVAASATLMAAAQAEMAAFKPGETVLFIGDSITHGGRQGDMNHYLGHGYAAEIASRFLGYHPEMRLVFLNRGISGNTSADLVRRWERDAVAPTATERGWAAAFPGVGPRLEPDVVSILVGINDYLHPDEKRRVSAEDYEANLETMVARLVAARPGVRIVVCEPFRLPVDASPDFVARQAAARRVAERHGLCFVDFQRLFSETLLKENPNPGYWFWDDFHPTYAAHIRMADYWLAAVDAFERNRQK